MKKGIQVIMMVLAIVFTPELKDFLVQNTYLIVNECTGQITVNFYFPPVTTFGFDMNIETQYNECITIRQNQQSDLQLGKNELKQIINNTNQK